MKRVMKIHGNFTVPTARYFKLLSVN